MSMSYKASNDILNERHPITVETAMLFEAALDISAMIFLGMQMEYNVSQAKKDKNFLIRLASIRNVAAVL